MWEINEAVKFFTLSLGSAVEGIAAIVIAGGVLRAVISYFKNLLTRRLHAAAIRLELGMVLAVALEFLLAADVLRTAVSPTWNDIGKLVSIALLRTLLNFFLEGELQAKSVKKS